MPTLYKHQIYCLHASTGELTVDAGISDTTFTVQQAVIDDVTIAVGSQIELDDGGIKSPILTITAIDDGANTITVDIAPGRLFQAATPTVVSRVDHWVHQWSESATNLTTCPEDVTHAVQSGSAAISVIQKDTDVTISQGKSVFCNPEIEGKVVTAVSGGDSTNTHTWISDVTLMAIEVFVEQANQGDIIDLFLGVDTNAGKISSSISSGVKVISVSDAVILAARIAFLCKIKASATENELGRILAIDENAKTITVATATTDAFTTAADILLTQVVADDLPLPAYQTTINIGGSYIAGIPIDAGCKLTIGYHNSGGSASRIIVYVKTLT